MIRQYYLLTKPGIIRGNLLTAIGGFFLASRGSIAWLVLGSLLCGMALVIGGACVFNNVYDRNIDKQMKRTAKRALVSGMISVRAAVVFGTVLSVIGTGLLIWQVNVLTALLGLFGLVTYAWVYTTAKHRTPYATLLGTIPGAVPPVAGYTAISGRLDLTCGLLFAILVCWQMPHFYAIAIRRLDEYKAAHVPVWPAVYSIAATKRQMVVYMIAFIGCVVLLSASDRTSWLFGLVLGAYGLYWLYIAVRSRSNRDDVSWAKTIFLLSLPVLPLFSVLLIISSLLR